jgi:isoamylase
MDGEPREAGREGPVVTDNSRRGLPAPAVHSRRKVEAGTDVRLGARWDGSGTNFALFSAHATKVELCLFDAQGRRETDRIELPEFTHQVWHGYLPEVRPGQLYGYRVHGPHAPEAGHRFNPAKLLLDPYALAHRGALRWHPAVFGYRIGHSRQDLSLDRRDSAFVVPKCVVVDPAHTWGNDLRPNVPWSRTIVYEAHVKGMTARHPDIDPRLRGTFEGLAQDAVIDHLVRLGVTSIELLPVQAFHDDGHLVDKGLANYWGYNTLGFFAPAQRYLTQEGHLNEFKLMVRRLHEAGIEVLMDVVYNHTAEGNHLGPTLSFRGIDNASYYLLGDDPRYYYDTTGTGNSLDLRNSRVLQMVMDSLGTGSRSATSTASASTSPPRSAATGKTIPSTPSSSRPCGRTPCCRA